MKQGFVPNGTSNRGKRARRAKPSAASSFLPSAAAVSRKQQSGSLLSDISSHKASFEPVHLPGDIGSVDGLIDDRLVEPEGPQSLEEELWQVFTSYCYDGSDSGLMTARQFLKLLKDCNLISSRAGAVDGAQASLLFTKVAASAAEVRKGELQRRTSSRDRSHSWRY